MQKIFIFKKRKRRKVLQKKLIPWGLAREKGKRGLSCLPIMELMEEEEIIKGLAKGVDYH